MLPPPIPANDAERVAVLRSIGVLDTPPEPDYDDLTQLAAQICDVPIALITLIDAERQWFKSKLGIGGTETAREVAFCAHVVAQNSDELFIVPDAHTDPRFSGNPSVMHDPKIRFYAGAPLVTHDGWSLGTLCVVDRQPRSLTPKQQQALRILRRHVVNALELRRLVGNQNHIIADLDRTRQALDSARRQAEEATRAKADFLASMSHEIRTPMNAVIGMTTVLRSTTLSPEQRESLDIIHGSGEHLLGIINDILDFSKIESGKLEIEFTPFSVADCVGAAVKLITPRAAEKKIPVRIHIEPNTPPAVAGDVTRIRQILVNLLGNAVKFTERGEIVVRVSARPAVADRCELTFSVQDSGIGIPGDRIGRLFQEFSQVDASTTRRFGGTGLGLAIGRRLAELHGGRMWVESEPGRGSCFHFTILARPAVLLASPTPLRSATGSDEFDPHFALRHPARVLVAEDNLVNQKVASRLLQKLGYTPEIAGDGKVAIEALRRTEFDVVLMDVEMPELDGLAATRAIRAEFPRARQPAIIALTAHAISGSRETFLAAGMDAYLAKPIRVAELTAMLAQAADLRRRRSGG